MLGAEISCWDQDQSRDLLVQIFDPKRSLWFGEGTAASPLQGLAKLTASSGQALQCDNAHQALIGLLDEQAMPVQDLQCTLQGVGVVAGALLSNTKLELAAVKGLLLSP